MTLKINQTKSRTQFFRNFKKICCLTASLLIGSYQFSHASLYDGDGTAESTPKPVSEPRVKKWLPTMNFGGKLGNHRHLGQVSLFTPLAQSEDELLYLDFRFTGDTKRSREGNFGIGKRWITQDNQFILGVYGFYDRRRTPFHNIVNQAMVGFEAMSDTWDYRVNFYYPQRTVKQREKSKERWNQERQGHGANNAYLYTDTHEKVTRVKEVPLKGLDLEIGTAIPNFKRLRIYGAYYRFQGAAGVKSINGFRLRGNFKVTDNFSLLLEGSRDNARKGNVFAGFQVRIPLGGSSQPSRQLTSLEGRMVELPQRDVDIVTNYAPIVEEKIVATVGRPLLNNAALRGVKPDASDIVEEFENELDIFREEQEEDSQKVEARPKKNATATSAASTTPATAATAQPTKGKRIPSSKDKGKEKKEGEYHKLQDKNDQPGNSQTGTVTPVNTAPATPTGVQEQVDRRNEKDTSTSATPTETPASEELPVGETTSPGGEGKTPDVSTQQKDQAGEVPTSLEDSFININIPPIPQNPLSPQKEGKGKEEEPVLVSTTNESTETVARVPTTTPPTFTNARESNSETGSSEEGQKDTSDSSSSEYNTDEETPSRGASSKSIEQNRNKDNIDPNIDKEDGEKAKDNSITITSGKKKKPLFRVNAGESKMRENSNVKVAKKVTDGSPDSEEVS